MDRLTHIDILKGIAILLVVMGHLFVPYTDYLDSPINQMIYSVHMPLFFFLSGFVFHVKKDAPHWLGKAVVTKVITLLFPFISFSILYSLCMGISYYGLLFANEMHNGYWFTLVLFEIMVISLIVNLINKWGGVKLDFVLNVCITIMLLGIVYLDLIPAPYKTLLSTDKVAKFYMYFQMGKFVNTYTSIKNVFRSQYTYIIGLISYTVLFAIWGYDLQSVNACSFILPICGIIVLVNVVEKNQSVLGYRGILPWIGQHSLEIYLIHFFVLSAIPKDIIVCNGILYLQIVVLLLLSLCCISVSLVASFAIRQSEILSLIFLGRGKLKKHLLSKI